MTDTQTADQLPPLPPRDQWPPAIYVHCIDCRFYLPLMNQQGGLCRERPPRPMLVSVPANNPQARLLTPPQQGRPQMMSQLQAHYPPVPPWESCGKGEPVGEGASFDSGEGDDDEAVVGG